MHRVVAVRRPSGYNSQKRIAYVECDTIEHAEAMCNSLQNIGTQVGKMAAFCHIGCFEDGKKIFAAMSKPPRALFEPRTLFVSNLPLDVDEIAIRDAFSQHGIEFEYVFVKPVSQWKGPRSRNEGTARSTYAYLRIPESEGHEETLVRALKLSETLAIAGNTVSVERSIPMRNRRGQRDKGNHGRLDGNMQLDTNGARLQGEDVRHELPHRRLNLARFGNPSGTPAPKVTTNEEFRNVFCSGQVHKRPY